MYKLYLYGGGMLIYLPMPRHLILQAHENYKMLAYL